jgi:hypothetical protein
LLLAFVALVAESVCSFVDFKVESAISYAVVAVLEALSFEFQVHVALSLACSDFSSAAPAVSFALS